MNALKAAVWVTIPFMEPKPDPSASAARAAKPAWHRWRPWPARKLRGAAGAQAPSALARGWDSVKDSGRREKQRLSDELRNIKGAWPLLMKQRRGGKWTPEDKRQLRGILRSASALGPYVLIWFIPGSMLLLPFLAWYLDRQRQRHDRGHASDR
jgi:hypothetical protein